jgi:ATP:ADP antiporter, AAA family
MQKSSWMSCPSGHSRMSKMCLRLRQLVDVEPREVGALFWSFAYFFVLLCSYYIVRPMRDEMGIAGGVDKLQWMFTGTFLSMLAVVPLFGWLAKRFSVRRFLPVVYYFFIADLLLFYLLFESNITQAYVARSFFIWASVYNLFIVSVFWSFMVDIFTNDQAKRLFGVIAAGGTAGALTGPALTAVLVIRLGPTNMLLVSAAFLSAALWCIHRIIAWKKSAAGGDSTEETGRDRPEDQVIGGSIWGQFFLKFIVSHPAVTCEIPATSNVRHMQDSMAAGYGALPTPVLRKRMVQYLDSLS